MMRSPKPENRSQRATVAVTVKIPAAIAPQFGRNARDIARRLLELAALEAFRSNQLSRGDVARMLDMDWAETEEFLAQHQCDRHYDFRDLAEDRHNLDEIFRIRKPEAK